MIFQVLSQHMVQCPLHHKSISLAWTPFHKPLKSKGSNFVLRWIQIYLTSQKVHLPHAIEINLQASTMILLPVKMNFNKGGGLVPWVHCLQVVQLLT